MIVEARWERGEELEALLGASGRRLVVAPTLERAFELLAREPADVLIVAGGMLGAYGPAVVERVEALAPGAAIVVCVPIMPPGARCALLRSLDLHGVHQEGAQDDAALVDLVESGLASARRARRLMEKSELRELIVAKLCHEMRGCLHVLQGYAEILCGEPTVAASGEVAARIGATSGRALRLVQDYLELARLASPGAGAQCQAIELDALIDELRAEAERQIGARPLVVRTEVAERGAILETDGEKLRAILGHLLANAVKFTARGEIRLAVRSREDGTEFVVSDDGGGIADQARATLFTPFAQGPGEPLTSTPGQGLGLAIAVRLSKLLGASLEAGASPCGARFTLLLPVAATRRAFGLSAFYAQESVLSGRILH